MVLPFSCVLARVSVVRFPCEQLRKLGYSYSLKFVRNGNEPDQVEELALAVESLGRKKSNDMVKKITAYISDLSQTEVI